MRSQAVLSLQAACLRGLDLDCDAISWLPRSLTRPPAEFDLPSIQDFFTGPAVDFVGLSAYIPQADVRFEASAGRNRRQPRRLACTPLPTLACLLTLPAALRSRASWKG